MEAADRTGTAVSGRASLIERYRERLPVSAATPVVSLGEGSTPLLPARTLGSALEVDLHLKLEGANPTGSFKDRGMTLAVSRAVEDGATGIICASTGNTAASAAAYAARAGLRCIVVVPGGQVALGKLAQAQVAGATVAAIDGSFDDALRIVREIAERHPLTLVNNLNPARLEGQKTAAFEVVEELGEAPEWLALPVGNGGNITAYWRGFGEAVAHGDAGARPRLLGAQAEGSASMVLGQDVAHPDTVATAIRIGAPVRRAEAAAAAEESAGAFVAVPDAEILHWFGRLAAEEGVFCEPSSATSVAGLARARADGRVPAGARVVCVLTGHGLKDPESAIGRSAPPRRVPAERAALERLLLEQG
jgi:threonine synthase